VTQLPVNCICLKSTFSLELQRIEALQRMESRQTRKEVAPELRRGLMEGNVKR
jgi:hypothetical protein